MRTGFFFIGFLFALAFLHLLLYLFYPAQRANLHTGDVVLAVAGTEVKDLASLFRQIWAQGEAGVEVPLLIYRDGRIFEVRVSSGDRNRFLKGPSVH